MLLQSTTPTARWCSWAWPTSTPSARVSSPYVFSAPRCLIQPSESVCLCLSLSGSLSISVSVSLKESKTIFLNYNPRYSSQPVLNVVVCFLINSILTHRSGTSDARFIIFGTVPCRWFWSLFFLWLFIALPLSLSSPSLFLSQFLPLSLYIPTNQSLASAVDCADSTDQQGVVVTSVIMSGCGTAWFKTMWCLYSLTSTRLRYP